MDFLNRSKTYVAGAVVVVLMAAALGVQAKGDEMPGKGVTARMARATWDTGRFPTEVYRQLLQELGYEVPAVTVMTVPAFYTAVGKGELDLWVEGWAPLHYEYKNLYEPAAEMIGHVVKGTALQGYLIDKATVEKFGIKTLSDVKRDDVRKALDANGDGKADLVACPSGWGCSKVIAYQMEAYDLKPYVNTIETDDYAGSMVDAYRRHKEGKPIFYYTWTPNWTADLLKPGKDVMWIPVEETKLPESSKPYADKAVLSGLEGCVADPCNLGWPANDIVPVANKTFLKNNPATAALLKNVNIPIADIIAQNAKMHRGEDSPEDIARHARDWIKDNQGKVDKWLKLARDAA